MSLVKQELLTLPQNVSSHPVFSGVRVSRSLVFCIELCRCLLNGFREEFEDTKGVIRICKSKRKKYKKKLCSQDLTLLHYV
jgi:hypothetical protein